MNNELEEIWKEAILAFLEVLRKTTKKSVRIPVSQPGFELGNLQMQL
jgi:hypothetical protein